MTLTSSATLQAALKLPNIFSDHMVLQQQRPIPVWGQAAPGTEVSVAFAGQSASTTASDSGEWKAWLKPETASSEPRVLTVTAGETTRRYEDVLVGEVWLCSGQSNMDWSVQQVKDSDLEVLAADLPHLRLYHVTNVVSQEPRESDDAVWEICSTDTIPSFSAVGYYYGRDLLRTLDVPMGLINASWGGTPAIAWTRPEAYDQMPALQKKHAEWEKAVSNYADAYEQWEKDLEHFIADRNLVIFHKDPGIADACRNWHQTDFDDSVWTPVSLPTTFEKTIGDIDGAVWYRRTVELPADMQGQELSLDLGIVDDFDHTWVNGQLVGSMTKEEDAPWQVSRHYTVPADLTRGGKLTLAVRIFDRFGGGGFMSPPAVMKLRGPSGELPLAGEWRYAVELELEPSAGPWALPALGAPAEPLGPNSPHRPGSLAYGMLAPVAPYAVRGAIWYQGETDAGWEPERYGERLRVMIEDWREWWQIDDLYFNIVQLANYGGGHDEQWPEIREGQRRLARDLPHAGLAVAIDIGEGNDIHPLNKQEVGRRLARRALADVYEKLALRGGPELAEAEFEGGQVRLRFTQVADGLHALDRETLEGFALAGTDGTFHPAEAKIESPQTIVVSSPEVTEATTVRYAWQANPAKANLTNSLRLPASPFEVSK